VRTAKARNSSDAVPSPSATQGETGTATSGPSVISRPNPARRRSPRSARRS
jgi:hypothetical protein